MLIDDALAKEIETAAVEMARSAGDILAGHFGKQISVEYKDKDKRDPVTEVDKSCQDFLSKEINRKFPDHGILGEETPDRKDNAGVENGHGSKQNSGRQSVDKNTDKSQADNNQADKGADGPGNEPSPDFLWVLDPLDGTTNFLNGLPVYASSIGVLHKGWPVAAALFIPWPNPKGGFVLHCRKGGGCFADDEPVSVYQSEELIANKLVGLPGSFSVAAQFGPKVRSKAGEMRTTGSIAYELAMTAIGVMQYSIFGAPRMWDMAGGALAVIEATGTVMTKFRGEKQWHSLGSVVPNWESKPPTMKELRGWMAPLVAGNQQLAPLIAENIKPRFRPMAKVRSFSKKLLPKKSQSQHGH